MKEEKLSALIDDELSLPEREEILAELSRDRGLQAMWTRYHLARAVIRNEVDKSMLLSEVADGVSRRLASEPVVLTPNRLGRRVAAVVGTLAIAASVAGVAIVGLQWLQSDHAAPVQIAGNAQPQQVSTRVAQGDHDLNLYLVEHNEFSPSSNFKGMMSYGRVVSYENGR